MKSSVMGYGFLFILHTVQVRYYDQSEPKERQIPTAALLYSHLNQYANVRCLFFCLFRAVLG